MKYSDDDLEKYDEDLDIEEKTSEKDIYFEDDD